MNKLCLRLERLALNLGAQRIKPAINRLLHGRIRVNSAMRYQTKEVWYKVLLLQYKKKYFNMVYFFCGTKEVIQYGTSFAVVTVLLLR